MISRREGDQHMAKEETAVIVVDVQRDFTQLANGTLAVEGTDQSFIDRVREGTETLKRAGFPIFATQDWHPPDHISFYTRHKGKKPFDVITVRGREQVLWPPHCVQGAEGARLLLDEDLFEDIVKTGADSDFESYSGFEDESGQETSLHRLLQERGVTRLVIYGIATDYCVKVTVLDAVARGYQVLVIKSLIRGVTLDTSRKALGEMEQEGVTLLDEVDLDKITP
jgi:nicotinamidase/pyrazinamidase